MRRHGSVFYINDTAWRKFVYVCVSGAEITPILHPPLDYREHFLTAVFVPDYNLNLTQLFSPGSFDSIFWARKTERLPRVLYPAVPPRIVQASPGMSQKYISVHMPCSPAPNVHNCKRPPAAQQLPEREVGVNHPDHRMGEGKAPKMLRLHFVREEVIAS